MKGRNKMYFGARIFGISTFIIFIFLMNYVISRIHNNNTLKKLFIFYISGLTIMAYNYVPSTSADLYRIMGFLETHYSKMSFQTIMQLIQSNGNKAAEILYYIFGKIGNPHLLPAFVALVYYGVFFYIVYRTKCLYNIKNKYVANSIMLFMISGQYLEVISNIRFPLAMSLICFCIFNEIIEQKRKIYYIFIYVFSAFLHQATMILVTIRVLYFVFQKSKNMYFKLFRPVILMIVIFCLFYFANGYITDAVNTGLSYISNEESYSYFWEFLIAIICIIYMIISMKLFSNISRKFNLMSMREHNYTKFINFMIFVVIVCIVEYSMFTRFRTYVEFLFIPLHMILLQRLSEVRYKVRDYSILTLFTKIILFFIVFSRGNMTALKFR